jgi:hypothetical protein
VTRALTFTREQLRAPFTLVLLIAVPVLFVVSAAGTLHDFAKALGGSLAGDAAVALSAGWAAAFLSGALGFFEAASSRGADRRLALAGLGPAKVAISRIVALQHGQLLDVVAGREVHPVCAWFAERSQAWRTVCAGLGPAKVAISRIVASISLATVAAVAAFVALELRGGVAHPWHAAVAIVAFAWLYLGLGVLVGSLVTDPLEGSLIVVFVFILDVFSGPGMGATAAPYAVSRKVADVLITAGLGRGSSGAEWTGLIITTAVALVVAFATFAFTARRRS